MRKGKFMSILLSSAMALSVLAGCGSFSSSSADTSADTSTETTETADTTDDTSSDETSGSDSTASADFSGELEGVELAVGTSGTYAPFSYFADDGTTLQGYDVAMLEELQKMLGFKIKDDKIQDMDYGPLGTSLSSGQLDVGAAALCATDERKKTMNFSETYYDAGIVVCVAKDNDTIKSVDDLTSGDYTVALQSGTIAYEYGTANLPESCIQSYDSQALAYKAVEDGQADATIYDLPGTNYGIKVGDINLKVVGDQFYTGQAPYAIAFSKDICEKYPHIIDDFNKAIDTLRDNGTLDELDKEWCQ